MNAEQQSYLSNTHRKQIDLRSWAELSDLNDPTEIDVLWLTALDSLKFSERQDRRDAHFWLQILSRASRMRIWEQLHQDRTHADTLRPIAHEQIRVVAEDVTRALHSDAKRRLEEDEASTFEETQSQSNFHVELDVPDFLFGSGRHDSNVVDEWAHINVPLSKPLLRFRDWCITNQYDLRRPHEML
ncbi:hypothetical protein BGZ65_007353, partial [Modicella reniformis]